MSRRLLSIYDLTDDDLDSLLAAAREFTLGALPSGGRRHAALLFFETSLRTRTGFAAAASRLGWPAPVEAGERRASDISMPESIEDTVAVLSAYFDTLVIRYDRPINELIEAIAGGTAIVNAGDRGPDCEHPTQALLDAFAMTELIAPIQSLRIALCGDLRMRSARSLLKLLARREPADLVLVTDPTLMADINLPENLASVKIVDSADQIREIDALHAIGIPHGAATEDVRRRLRVTEQALTGLSSRGLVFSPMPVIDEISRTSRSDPRMAFLRQSALGLFVRMAVLEWLSVPFPRP